MPGFGQVVVGPPGSGKTTYCVGMLQMFEGLGRDAVVFNMDPANESLPYEPVADISELVCVAKVAREHQLGPNGSLLYAMEVLENNPHWLEQKLKQNKGKYILFDFPGQVELYTHNQCVRNIVKRIVKAGYRIAGVNLVDAHYVADPAKYLAVLLTSVTQMLQLELPAVNVLSKIDLIERFGDLPLNLNLEYFTDAGAGDLSTLLIGMDKDPVMKRFAKLNKALIEVIEDFPFVAYHPLDINDKACMIRVIVAVDKANGYIFAGQDANKIAYQHVTGKPERDPSWTLDVQERYVKNCGVKDIS